MKNLLHSILFVFASGGAVFFSCNEHTVDPVFYGDIEGTVTFEASGAPAAGVEITTAPTTTTVFTDERGNFLITDVPTGEYSVEARLEGYTSASNSITVSRNKTTFTEVKLVPDAAAPNSPTLVFPAAGAEDVDRSTTLKWRVTEKNNDELKYDVVLYESNQQTPLINLTDHPDTTVTIQDLKFNTIYFWQVKVKNSSGIVTSGELWQFKTRPFPDNRFLFTSQQEGNYDIYSSNESKSDSVRITYSEKDQVYPRYSNDRTMIAYVENTNLEFHIYIMNRDGSSPVKITTLPVAGFHNDGRGFCWSPDNGKILYSHYDKLYTIDRNGSNLTLVATAPAGKTFRACDWTPVGNRIVVETVSTLPYKSEIRLIDLVKGTNNVIISDEAGIIENPSFSTDGNSILFTRDVSGFESETGRQLDTHIFTHHIPTGARTDHSAGKESGTNDLNPRYSPDGTKIIFENKNNDESGISSVYTYDIPEEERTKMFDNASMPDWQ